MRHTARTLVVALAAVGAAGCQNFGKKSAGRDDDRGTKPADSRPTDARPWWTDAEAAGPRPAAAESEGVLAGRILDANDPGRSLDGGYITFVVVDDLRPASTGKEPSLGVSTDRDGWFVIPGLTAGKSYLLTAVLDEGGRKIAGSVQARVPSSKILIRMTEGGVSSLTPKPLAPPGSTGPFATPPAEARPKGDAPATPSADDRERGWRPDGPPGPPRSYPDPLLEPSEPARPAGRPTVPGSIPGPPDGYRPPPPSVPPPPIRKTPILDPAVDPVAYSSAWVAPNFKLVDVAGRPWEFRTNSGRLVLLDFWRTNCGPCLRAMPHVKQLQSDYGSAGLEVVGVALEDGDTWAENARAVEAMAKRKELNYRVYLEPDGQRGRVQKAFNVERIPTLVLLDHKGNLMWTGGASDGEHAKLDAVIRAYLTKRR